MRLEERSAGLIHEPGSIEAPACHAATLLPRDDGSLLAAFFAGRKEGARDVAIWWSERTDGRWSEPRALPRARALPHWNPVLYAGAGETHLAFKVGRSPRRWSTWCSRRPASGGDWSRPEELVPGDVGGRGPVKNKPIRLADGALLAPASIETRRAWDCFVDRSEDGGRSWRRSPLVPFDHARHGRGIIQPTLWESAPGRVHLLARSTAGRVFRADSEDGGACFGPARPTPLPNNDSGIDVARLADGTLVLAHNPVETRKVRTPLCLAVSTDEGETWEEACVLEDAPGEWSYPAIVATAEGVAVAYTWDRRAIMVRDLAVVAT